MDINPFNITKATDFSDEEINAFWVDISEGKGFVDIMKPNSPMSLFMLGGKGSGKTHLMRYYSFPLQKIRCKTSLLKNIASEGYLGIYFRCSGLNSNRFSNKNQSDDLWQSLFSYYMELWLSQITLKIICELKNEEISRYERTITEQILELFDEEIKLNEQNLTSLINTLVKFQKTVDSSVNNYSIKRTIENVKINVSPGSLIFGIPEIIAKTLPEFKNIQFLYLIDEFENLTLAQQKYINTLIRDKRIPCSFRIGSRLYGIKTYDTFSADEENKEGSEYEKFIIDEHFRTKETERKYEDFVQSLTIKRLSQYGQLPIQNVDRIKENLEGFFEIFNPDIVLDYLRNKYASTLPPYIIKLEKKLQESGASNINSIVTNLRYTKNLLLERTNIFLFYREWKSGIVSNALEYSENIKKDLNDYVKGNKKSKHGIVLDKFKNDLLDQLFLECGEKVIYSGITSFIKMSAGIPRILLVILKQIYKWSNFNGEQPFKGRNISLEAQQKGVRDAVEWFFEDARIVGRNGKQVRDSISKLGQFLREIRFSDTPPECSICAFRINLSEISQVAFNTIELATQYSFLIKKGLRKDKNSKRKDQIYQLNGILSPKWDLPIYKRGELSLTKEEVECIFNPTDSHNFNMKLHNRLNKYNVLYSKTEKQQTQQKLF